MAVIGRHEFPKRAELAVAAAHLLPHRRFILVGSGGRLAWARSIDARLAAGEDPTALTDERLSSGRRSRC